MITNPDARASPKDTIDFLVSLEIAFINGVKITKPESQNIGIETKKPVIAIASSSLPFPKIFKKHRAIFFAAPETSKSCPIITPKPIMIPMLPKVPPKPFVILPIICGYSIPPTIPTMIVATIKAKNV